MTGNCTLTIIKPHSVRDNDTGAILSTINAAGFRIIAIKMIMLSERSAREFYIAHEGRDFYDPLCKMMCSGPVVVAILEKDNAVNDFRLLIGNTDPEKSGPGTIRKLFGKSMRENAIHASDGDESAARECAFFFSELERFNY